MFIIWFFQIVVFIGANSAGSDTWGQFRDNWLEIPRFLASGVTMALFITTLPMAAAAFTQRQSVGAAFVIGSLAILEATGWVLSSQIHNAAAPWLALIDLGAMPIHVNDIIFNRDFAGASANADQGAARWAVIGIYMILIAAPAALLWSKYRKASL